MYDDNITAGGILKEMYLDELGISPIELADKIMISYDVVDDIVAGQCPITADVAYRLSLFLGTTPELWLNLQSRCDLLEARNCFKKSGDIINPYK